MEWLRNDKAAFSKVLPQARLRVGTADGRPRCWTREKLEYHCQNEKEIVWLKGSSVVLFEGIR